MTALLFSLVLVGAPVEQHTAIVTDRVVTVTAGVVEKGVILIKAGKVVKIAPRLPLPPKTKVIKADTLIAYPGIEHRSVTCGDTARSLRSDVS